MKKNNIFVYGLTALCLFSLHTLNASLSMIRQQLEIKEKRENARLHHLGRPKKEGELWKAIATSDLAYIDKILKEEPIQFFTPNAKGVTFFHIATLLYDNVAVVQKINQELQKNQSLLIQLLSQENMRKLTGSSRAIPEDIAAWFNLSDAMIEEILKYNALIKEDSKLSPTVEDFLQNQKLTNTNISKFLREIIHQCAMLCFLNFPLESKNFPWNQRSFPTCFQTADKNPLPKTMCMDESRVPRIVLRPTEKEASLLWQKTLQAVLRSKIGIEIGTDRDQAEQEYQFSLESLNRKKIEQERNQDEQNFLTALENLELKQIEQETLNSLRNLKQEYLKLLPSLEDLERKKIEQEILISLEGDESKQLLLILEGLEHKKIEQEKNQAEQKILTSLEGLKREQIEQETLNSLKNLKQEYLKFLPSLEDLKRKKFEHECFTFLKNLKDYEEADAIEREEDRKAFEIETEENQEFFTSLQEFQTSLESLRRDEIDQERNIEQNQDEQAFLTFLENLKRKTIEQERNLAEQEIFTSLEGDQQFLPTVESLKREEMEQEFLTFLWKRKQEFLTFLKDLEHLQNLEDLGRKQIAKERNQTEQELFTFLEDLRLKQIEHERQILIRQKNKELFSSALKSILLQTIEKEKAHQTSLEDLGRKAIEQNFLTSLEDLKHKEIDHEEVLDSLKNREMAHEFLLILENLRYKKIEQEYQTSLEDVKQREIFNFNIARIKKQRQERMKKLLTKTSIATACIVGCGFLFKKLH